MFAMVHVTSDSIIVALIKRVYESPFRRYSQIDYVCSLENHGL